MKLLISLMVAVLPNTVAAQQSPVFITPPQFAESQLWHVNSQGNAIGRCELYDAKGTSIADFGCICTRGGCLPVPKLDAYSRMECVAISDTGVVVGHAYSPKSNSIAALQAIVYDPVSNTTQPLPALDDNAPAIATSIAAAGDYVAGVCRGKACLWLHKDNVWNVQSLPLPHAETIARHVVLSDDGKTAAASVRHNRLTQLMIWHRDESETWISQVRLSEEVSPLDVNNAGAIVGTKTISLGGTPATRGFVLLPKQSIQMITPFPGDNFTTARSINNLNIVVGWSDATGESDKGPRGFYLQDEKLAVLQLNELEVTAHQAFAINDSGVVVGLAERIDDPHCVGFILPHQKSVDSTQSDRGR